MTNPRFAAIDESTKHTLKSFRENLQKSSSEFFDEYVFTPKVMAKRLPKHVYQNVLDAMASKAKILPQNADVIALAIKEWALSLGATHYTHWFQPLTGASAEKHDSFLDWSESGGVLEQFSGNQLIQGEPDASSFPSGGLRSTYEARGYTGWDPTSPIFLWKAGDGLTLCIPTIFFSWTGEVLDTKIPLLRSDEKINKATLRLLRLTGIDAERVYSTLGLEQEYFVIDRSLKNLRPDLILLGKTVYGALPAKGQELQDHYLGSVKNRILTYMQEFELEALKVGIPVKTRHNEVAPAQHEVAPVFEKASKAIDHNILLMELMRHIAVKHNLSCLLHEKPFKGLNGSGKHSNWSLATDKGINLLDPTDTPGSNLNFLILITAILHAVHTHASLLRASIGSASNDNRLGGHEAPPAIISVYLGKALESVLDAIEEKGTHSESKIKEIFDLGLPINPDFKKDNTDRNRTSPFAFTGNKFEFRAVGSSANPSFSITVLNATVAESINQMVDEIEKGLKGKRVGKKELLEASIPVIRKFLKLSKPIRFSGDNYSDSWKKEAKSRKLPNLEVSVDAFNALKLPSTISCFHGILQKQELFSRFEVALENYMINIKIEVQLMVEIFNTQILPVTVEALKLFAKTLGNTEKLIKKGGNKGLKLRFERIHVLLEKAIEQSDTLNDGLYKEFKGTPEEQVLSKTRLLLPLMEKLRETVDKLEQNVDDRLWPLPKYRELLFII